MLTRIFKKSSKLEFACLIPEVVKTMPIVESNQINFDWLRMAISNWKEVRENSSKHDTPKHIAKCPGINAISRRGWVQRAYQDILINTDGSGGFAWKTPIDQSIMNLGHEFVFPYVGHHSSSLVEPFGFIKNGTLPTIIKIQSPWIAKIPKGYYLLVLPIPYPDDKRFTSTAGILDPELGVNFLNIQIYWHCLNSEEIIPAGTPLAQYFLVKKEEIDVEVRVADQDDINDLRLRRMQMESTFIPAYAKLKNLFGRDK